MNKRQEIDVMIVRAKINAQKALRKYMECWYAEEPKEVSGGNNQSEQLDEG